MCCATLLFWLIAVLLWPHRVAACTQWSQAPNSQWKVEVDNGVAWLRTPCGERFLSLGVNAIDGGQPAGTDGRESYYWGSFYPDLATWAAVTRQRLLDWGFNTAGAWSIEEAKLALPFIPSLELARTLLFLWNEPFRPSMEEEMRQLVRRLIAPYKGNPYRIGYFPDNEIGWWYPAFFLYYIQEPPSSPTKQRLLALLRQHYGDDWQRFEHDFVPPSGVTSFADLLASHGTSTRLRVGGAGIQAVRRWMGVVAAHYYGMVQRALRQEDPEALIFSDRLQIYYDHDTMRALTPYVDVVASNYDVDGEDGTLAQYYFEGLRQLTNQKPVLVSEWFFAAQENRSGNLNQHTTADKRVLHGLLRTVQTQEERARGATAAAQAFARLPNLVGLHWFQYTDEPRGGRPDGEDYNLGLVDIYDQPYELLTAAFRHINPRLMALHQEAQSRVTAPPASSPLEIPAARIDLHDRSLRDWPKARALVPGMTAPASEAIFGDVYLAWDQQHLYLATISMDHCEPTMLAFEGDTFPRAEAFHIDWGIDVGTGPQHFRLYLVPPRRFLPDGTSNIQAYFCRVSTVDCVPVPLAQASYFGNNSPRLVAEVALPWQALGLEGPPIASQLRMELAATASHRARWMSWSGQPPQQGMQASPAWHAVRLGQP